MKSASISGKLSLVDYAINTVAFLALYLICWNIYKDYGVSIDEPLHLTRVPLYFHQWKQIFTNGYVENVSGGMRYGVIFNLIAHPFITTFSKNTRFLLEAYEIKHIVTFHVYFLTYLSIAYALYKTCGYKYAGVLTVFILTLFPNLFGQSFFNPKDIPFAAFFTISSVLIAIRTSGIIQNIQANKEQNFIIEGLVIALLIALASSVRISGLVIVPAWMTVFLLNSQHLLTKKTLGNLITLLLSTFVFLTLFLLVLYPSAFSSPIKWMFGTVQYFNNGTGFGRRADIGYIYTLFWIKIPVLWLALSSTGILFFLKNYNQLGINFRIIGIMLLLQIIAIPMLMIMLETRTYHQERHFLSSYPPIAFFAGYGLYTLYNYIVEFRVKIIFIGIVGLLSLNIVKEMIALHPYQYVYLNEIGRYKEKIPYKLQDYWGLSRKPIFRWLAKNTKGRPSITTEIGYGYAPDSITNTLYGSPRLRTSYYRGHIYVGSAFVPKNCDVLYKESRYLGNILVNLGAAYNCYQRKTKYKKRALPNIMSRKKNDYSKQDKVTDTYNFFTPEL